MYSSLNSLGAVTIPKETDNLNSSRCNEACKYSENLNPNVSRAVLKLSNSSSIKFGNSAEISDSSNPDCSTVDQPLVEKKIAKMNSCCKELNSSKETAFCRKSKGSGNGCLRACHEDSFNCDVVAGWEEIERQCELSRMNGENEDYTEKNRENSENDLNMCMDRLWGEARGSVPEPGSGRVMHLVKAFEELLSIHKLRDSEEEVQEVENAPQQPLKVCEMQDSSLFPSEFFISLKSLDLHSRRSCLLDSSQESLLTKTSAGCRRSWLSSPESVEMFSRPHRRRKPRTTSPKPFMLQTEERGKIKEKEFMKKLQQMMKEEEKLRMPTTQGLPWTTEEPECVVKPPAKENTRPVDLVLHSDTRAVQRAGFDHQVAKKISLLEHYRMEREKQQKLTEEDEIRRLRRELIPKALPMPYFNRPFVPKRSAKHPTIPREPKFQIPLYKMKSLKSLDSFCLHQ
ncbi:microtubule-destabilizing protein 60-like isoform X2 [Primulina huaijiensis]|uniref:microtubule-destabilizing protein 60-like isoform X2 n=1 Tax=Primulina huaijiensis TaxID=1492673 RepID=UPI003CC75187